MLHITTIKEIFLNPIETLFTAIYKNDYNEKVSKCRGWWEEARLFPYSQQECKYVQPTVSPVSYATTLQPVIVPAILPEMFKYCF